MNALRSLAEKPRLGLRIGIGSGIGVRHIPRVIISSDPGDRCTLDVTDELELPESHSVVDSTRSRRPAGDDLSWAADWIIARSEMSCPGCMGSAGGVPSETGQMPILSSGLGIGPVGSEEVAWPAGGGIYPLRCISCGAIHGLKTTWRHSTASQYCRGSCFRQGCPEKVILCLSSRLSAYFQVKDFN
ncbi:hypothetical protein P170DRAFT_80589 [Aspergillus steynii IBT 23096]|uniref:Uncharacterized protein n=1 Tax=Aspergillus steynii IBT 23096 TaxID=1392250 RepID=A0A2I2GF77_9EURO|nr:uncharacterized protein P170DRAFT_80589 [Aspergillus steynii IBT 23096]PLB51532.1 hypothetical protein P170DRAFT_80589 [Aspergillus steynii IBT 23096]